MRLSVLKGYGSKKGSYQKTNSSLYKRDFKTCLCFQGKTQMEQVVKKNSNQKNIKSSIKVLYYLLNLAFPCKLPFASSSLIPNFNFIFQQNCLQFSVHVPNCSRRK